MNFPPQKSVRAPVFFWRGVLILLPLALLAGLGIYSLRQDRLLAEAEARDRCQTLAGDYARAIVLSLQNPAPQAFSEITLDANGNLLAIGGSRSRAAMLENALPRPLPETALTPEQRHAWQAARTAESMQKGDAAALFGKFIVLGPPTPFLTHARYSLALLRAANRDPAADDLLRQVEEDRKTFSEGGLPLFLLAQYQRWKLAGPGRASGESLCSNAVEYPTLISPLLLASAPADSVKWLQVWQRDEAARNFFQFLQPALTNNAWRRGGFWVHWQEGDWLVFATQARDSISLAALPVSRVAAAVKKAEPSGQRQASYAQPGIELAGREILKSDPSWPLLAAAGAPLFSGSNLTVSERLARPDLLYARARTRTQWFAALILVSAAAAAFGLISAWRGFHQQRRLSEMKSNFVSSVSHELRAPIASMRLLAESLERGKIADPGKQKEYFGLLVQESRRLAMLIENILDYSRMERGGKKYEFEPADVAALVTDTVQLMRPCAAERSVELDLRINAGAGAESFSCDSLALQRALINLMDNAVKHSPPGGRVVVGLDGGAGGLSLWVEDNGPGIPAEEHGKIFERFYRRGSELRRETQGIGIGLAIVQHIVEAHGGRVAVRSAPGQGSRFTMELPRT
jgi:signal transduction histidine kinase